MGGGGDTWNIKITNNCRNIQNNETKITTKQQNN